MKKANFGAFCPNPTGRVGALVGVGVAVAPVIKLIFVNLLFGSTRIIFGLWALQLIFPDVYAVLTFR